MTELPPPPDPNADPADPVGPQGSDEVSWRGDAEPSASGRGSGGFEDWQRVVADPGAVAPAQRKRPAVVTAAAVILIVFGVFALLGGAIILAQGDAVGSVAGLDSDLTGTLAVVALISGALDVLVGVLILRLRPAGRVGGIILGTVGLASALFQLGSGAGFIGVAAYGFVVYALMTTGPAFGRR